MAATDTQLLKSLVDKRLACLTRLWDIGRRQLETIAQDDIDALLVLLDEKQRWLLLHQRLQQELRPFLNQSPESRHWREAADRDHCRQALQRCETIFQQIVEQERQSESQLKRLCKVVDAKLKTLGSAQAASAAYAQPLSRAGARLDLSSET